MTVRILASFVFFYALAAPAQPISPEFLPASVGVMLRFERKPSDHFLKQMESEVDGIFQPTGLTVAWEVLDGKHRPGAYSRVVIVEMRGRCSTPEPAEAEPGALRLGWTIVNDGEVSPFAVVDCDQVGRAINSAHSAVFRRNLIFAQYVRLAGRVLAHELMHALLKTTDHHETDIARSPLRAADLQIGARLTSQEVAALRDIGRNSPPAIAGRR